MKSNDELRNLAGEWDLVSECESSQSLLIYHVNPWMVEIGGKVSDQGTYDPDTNEVEFTVNDIYYQGSYTETTELGKLVRKLAGTCNDGSGPNNWTATFVN